VDVLRAGIAPGRSDDRPYQNATHRKPDHRPQRTARHGLRNRIQLGASGKVATDADMIKLTLQFTRARYLDKGLELTVAPVFRKSNSDRRRGRS
jgi:hypothetical protein